MINFEEEKTITVELSDEEPIQAEVYDINYIPSYKEAELQRITNENNRIANEIDREANETARETYYEDFKNKVDSGYFNGKDGKDGKDGEKGDKGDVGDTGYTLTNTVRGESITIEDAVEYKLFNLEIDGKSVQNGTPTPTTPIEIESVGYENLFDGEFRQGGNNSTTTSNYIFSKNIINCKENNTYSFSTNLDTTVYKYAIQTNTQEFPTNNANSNNTGWVTTSTTKLETTINGYLGILITKRNGTDITIDEIKNVKFQLEEGSIAHSYIPYGKTGIEVKVSNGTDTNTTVLALNKPLRSLPNGTKDITYIKNNKLYVDRYVGRIVLDGSESVWTTTSEGFYTPSHSWGNKSKAETLSNYFQTFTKYNGGLQQATNGTGFLYSNVYQYYLKIDGITTVEELKTWLSTHNTTVYYELETPVTEEVGDCVINTYAGVNNIDLETNLETEFSVTYAQDMKSILKDYPSMEEIQAYVDSQLGSINEQLASLTEVE